MQKNDEKLNGYRVFISREKWLFLRKLQGDYFLLIKKNWT
jgi:hypothetical protein